MIEISFAAAIESSPVETGYPRNTVKYLDLDIRQASAGFLSRKKG
jgi:hypothetical protein